LQDLEDGKASVLEEGVEEIKDCLAFSPDARVRFPFPSTYPYLIHILGRNYQA
jgi:hypothetical protein